MANTKQQVNILNTYDYMNENSIDTELKCSLCMQPFESPTSTVCGHTFCKACITQWIVRQPTCPTCRKQTSADQLISISTRIVLNQLDRLLMHCKRCNQGSIQRGDINDHEKRCPNQTVSCTAFDIKCPWKGTRNELTQHILECQFQKIRPAIDDIYEHLRNIYEPLVDELQTVRGQLEKQMNRNNEQIRFLVAVFNKGKPMSDQCSTQSMPNQETHNRNCIYRQQRPNLFSKLKAIPQQYPDGKSSFMQSAWSSTLAELNAPTSTLFNCASCRKNVDPKDIILHRCEGGIICQSCVETYGNLES